MKDDKNKVDPEDWTHIEIPEWAVLGLLAALATILILAVIGGYAVVKGLV